MGVNKRNALAGVPRSLLTVTCVSQAALVASATTAVTTASASATTAAPSAVTAASAATTTAATATFFTGPGFVDGDTATVVFLQIETGNCGLRFRVTLHFDKAEAFAAARVLVGDDLSALDCSILCEELLEV